MAAGFGIQLVPLKLFHSPLTLSCGSSISSNHILLFESHFGSKLAMTGTISHPNFCLIVSANFPSISSQTLCLCRTTRQNSRPLARLSRLCECPQSRRCLKVKFSVKNVAFVYDNIRVVAIHSAPRRRTISKQSSRCLCRIPRNPRADLSFLA